MKHFISSIFIWVLLSCGSYHNNVIPQSDRYIVFCTDSFDIYYNVGSLIYYCEEMKNPQSSLYNEEYTKMSHEDYTILKNICDDVRLEVNFLSLPSFDFSKSQYDMNVDLCAYYSVKDVEYLFYKYKNVLIKKHDDGMLIDDYDVRIKEGIGNDIVEIVNKQNKKLIFSFYWEQWWGKISKSKFNLR